jgi:hypothetical protein
MSNKIAFYTANIGGYDLFQDFFHFDKEIDYYCFTDNENVKSTNRWKVIYIHEKNFTQKQIARRLKAFPPFPLFDKDKYDIIIWADANFHQNKSLMPLVNKLKGNDILVMRHPERNCIYKESQTCINSGLGDKETTLAQIKRYKDEGFPDNYGLAATGLIVRKNNLLTEMFNHLWLKEISENSHRDQLSFDYVRWASQSCPIEEWRIKVDTIDFYEHEMYFYRHKHIGDRRN